MTAPHIAEPLTGPGLPNPELAQLHQYAEALKQLRAKDQSNVQIKHATRLTRILYQQESERLAVLRLEQNKEEAKRLSAGPVAAASVGGAVGVGTYVGAAAGTALGALGGPAAPVTIPLGGTLGGMAGGGLTALGIRALNPKAVDETMEQHPWLTLGGASAGISLPTVGKMLSIRMATGALKLAEQQVRTEVAVKTKDALIRQEVAKAAKAEQEVADMARRMGHPMRGQGATARYRDLIAKANKAEWDASIAQSKALGQLNPLEQRRLEVLNRTLSQADLRIEMMQQQLQLGKMKPAQTEALLQRTRVQLEIAEKTLTKAGANASFAHEEAALRVTTAREKLKAIQETLRQMGIAPEPMPAPPGRQLLAEPKLGTSDNPYMQGPGMGRPMSDYGMPPQP